MIQFCLDFDNKINTKTSQKETDNSQWETGLQQDITMLLLKDWRSIYKTAKQNSDIQLMNQAKSKIKYYENTH